MKVGTDGVLLGAWTDTTHTAKILDVGSGTGLIALMLAQRSDAIIHAIEIDENSYHQCVENINASKWKTKIDIHHTSFQKYRESTAEKYDLIVSNPPYFSQSLKPQNKSRMTARHNDNLDYEELFQGSYQLLTEHGKLSLILPYREGCSCVLKATDYHLFCHRLTKVKSTPGSTEKRLLLEFGKDYQLCIEDVLILEVSKQHEYSDAFKALTEDFYDHR
jgi:tRNA1Val (adenine37-N6)-methyltransferase